MRSFEDLVVWKEARNFRTLIAEIVKSFPLEEKFRLSDQIIRSSRSVCANIEEGYGRYHYKENIQYLRQARGSLNESLGHLICAHDEGFITTETLNTSRLSFEATLKLLNGYIVYLKNRKDEVREDPPSYSSSA